LPDIFSGFSVSPNIAAVTKFVLERSQAVTRVECPHLAGLALILSQFEQIIFLALKYTFELT
jgi:hypothetical protein